MDGEKQYPCGSLDRKMELVVHGNEASGTESKLLLQVVSWFTENENETGLQVS